MDTRTFSFFLFRSVKRCSCRDAQVCHVQRPRCFFPLTEDRGKEGSAAASSWRGVVWLTCCQWPVQQPDKLTLCLRWPCGRAARQRASPIGSGRVTPSDSHWFSFPPFFSRGKKKRWKTIHGHGCQALWICKCAADVGQLSWSQCFDCQCVRETAAL